MANDTLVAENKNWAFIGDVFTVKKKKTHDEQVNEALGLFTAAEEKMVSVIKVIDADIEAEREEIKAATNRIEAAAKSKSRLERTLDRLKALTA